MNTGWASGDGSSNARSVGSISSADLRIRWDRRPEVHQAFLSLAAGVICYRIWINES